jgi:hypothetical protein
VRREARYANAASVVAAEGSSRRQRGAGEQPRRGPTQARRRRAVTVKVVLQFDEAYRTSNFEAEGIKRVARINRVAEYKGNKQGGGVQDASVAR